MRGRLPALLVTLLLLGCSQPERGCAGDALQARSPDDLGQFTSWLDQHGVDGVVGEAGWPGEPRWTALADRWGRAASGAGVDTAGPAVVAAEGLVRSGPELGGVNLAGGSFGTGAPQFSARSPGVHGQAYRYPPLASLRFLAARAIRTVRLAVAWERLQSVPGGPLVAAETDRVRQVLRDADLARPTVVVDVHSYARFRAAPGQDLVLGSDALPVQALAALWRPLAAALDVAPALGGYGLMNEPHDLPGGAATWRDASPRAVAAVRTVDADTPVLVAGYAYGSAARWQSEQQEPWIDDENVVYEAHQYFDGDGSGRYVRSYDEELAAARAQGWTACGRPGTQTPG